MAESPRDASFASLFESSPRQGFARRHRVGEVLDLEVVRVSPEAVLVAVDGKQEGYIDPALLSDESGKPTVHVGSRVAVRVVSIDKSSGEIRLEPLSKDPVVANLGAGDGPADAAATKTGTSLVVGMRVKGKVAGVERYGVFLEFAVPNAPRPERGLVPVAELGTPRGADLRKLFPVGKELEAAIIAIDERGRVRLSVTALSAAEERRAFESYAGEKAEEKKEGGRNQSFGTFADLLSKKKK
ncbi:MAG TPA: S1 RNA-binding domain-containing protein [Polyangiaceae bacterium]|nr:S1 RNA-binding domain-containing protein [Polyangiaceae bacterium]